MPKGIAVSLDCASRLVRAHTSPCSTLCRCFGRRLQPLGRCPFDRQRRLHCILVLRSQNGGDVSVLLGKHFSDYMSAQTSYTWNENELSLSSGSSGNGSQQAYQETRSSSQQTMLGNVLVYFRARNSRLRPYLSVGTGFVHFASTRESLPQVLGAPTLLPRHFASNLIVLNVPVGMDVNLGRGWDFRYTFSETISSNPISDRLSPSGQHSFKNFQNLFGFVRRF